jgi:hypothetical protein
MTHNEGRGDERVGTVGSGSVTRRAALKSAAALGGGSVLFTGRASAAGVPDRLSSTFGSIVNVVDAGADPTGEESINDVLEDARADDTLLYFPDGRYYMDRQFRYTGFDNFGLYGDQAILEPADYHSNADDKHKMFRLGTYYSPGRRLVVENFRIDFTAPDTGVRSFDVVAGEELKVRKILHWGRHDSGMWGPGRFVVDDPQGKGLVGGFMARHGGEFNANTPSAGRLWRGPTGILCNSYNNGSITFRNCQLGSFPDNGLYAGGSNGPVTVVNGWYRNSNANSVRVGGPNPTIKGVTVYVDETSADHTAQKGIHLQDAHNATIDDCDITIDAAIHDSQGIFVRDGCSGLTTVKDTRVEMQTDRYNHGIDVRAGDSDFKSYRTEVVQNQPGGTAFRLVDQNAGENTTELINVDITGNPGHKWNRAAIYNARDNLELRKVRVDQGGGDRRRAVVNTGDDGFYYACDLRTNQYPVIDQGKSTWVSENYFESHRGYAGYYLTDASEDVYLRKNTIKNGIRDDGCTGLGGWGNDPDIF